jgi:hypothetical protein
VAFPAQTDALAVVDSGRDLDVERPFFERLPRALTRWARRAQDLARPPAIRARVTPDELPED